MKPRKLLSFTLSMVMIISILPTFTPTVGAASAEKNISLGKAALSGYDSESNSYKYIIMAHIIKHLSNGVFSQ